MLHVVLENSYFIKRYISSNGPCALNFWVALVIYDLLWIFLFYFVMVSRVPTKLRQRCGRVTISVVHIFVIMGFETVARFLVEGVIFNYEVLESGVVPAFVMDIVNFSLANWLFF